jgi:hypothetical protein
VRDLSIGVDRGRPREDDGGAAEVLEPRAELQTEIRGRTRRQEGREKHGEIQKSQTQK